MKKNKLSTEIAKLNLQEILANYRDPKFWKKQWTIFKHKDLVATWNIRSIDVEDNLIQSNVNLYYRGKQRVSSFREVVYCKSIPIKNSDYSQTTFSRNIASKLVEAIDRLEKGMISYTYEYKEAESLEDDEYRKLREIANDFLDREHVTNDEIREAYIDYYVSNATKFNYTGPILQSSIRKYYPTARLLIYSWFDDKKGFDEEARILNETKPKKKKLIFSIWKSRKELEGDDYLSEAEKLLEGL